MPGIDASIYGNVTPVPVNIPDQLDIATKAMTLQSIGIQQAQQIRQMQTQRAVQGAYANNTDPTTGDLNRTGFLSDLGKMNPMAAADYRQQFVQQDKQQAEAQSAQIDGAQKTLSFTVPAMHYLGGMTEDQRAAAYPGVIAQLRASGAPVHSMPDQYDPDHFQQMYQQTDAIGGQMKDFLANQQTQADVGKAQAETGKSLAETSEVPSQIEKTKAETAKAKAETILAGPKAAAELNSNLYGSRSPYSTQQDAYNKEAGPIHNSQVFMNQMLDSYKNKTPQGDAALVLNNFKIRNPGAVDVNSIDEMKTSQSVPDVWKNKLSQALNGGFDDPTRDNLIRDGISAYRANVDTLGGIQQKYRDISKQDNLPNSNFTNEPAVEKTNVATTALQNKIGPYVPLAERGGFMGGVAGAASKLFGLGGGNSTSTSSQAPSSQDTAALNWLKSADPSSPKAFSVRAVLKSKGLLQ